MGLNRYGKDRFYLNKNSIEMETVYLFRDLRPES